MEEKEKKEKSKVSFWKILKHYLSHTRGYGWQIALTFITTAVTSLASGVFSPVIYQRLIDEVSKLGNPYLSENILFYFKIFVAIGIVNFLFMRLGNYILNNTQSKIMERLSNTVFLKTVNHSRRFFSNNFSGAIVAKSGRFVRSFENIYDIILHNFWGLVITLGGILFVLFSKNVLLGVMFASFFTVFAVVAFFFAKYQIPFNEAKSAADTKTTGTFSDVITNILNIKIFSAFVSEFKTYAGFTKSEEKARIRTWNINLYQGTVLNICMVTLRMTSLWVGINLWAKGEITLGFLVLLQLYTSQLFEIVWQFNFAVKNFSRSVTDAKEMVEIFETPIDIQDPVKPEKCKIKNGNIVFENVSFEYKDGKDVFKKLNLSIPAGQKVGFVGESGSGKTTITNLLLRFEDVQNGSIKIDGQDIRNITQDDLRKSISYVPQEPALFHRSIKENIAYGKAGAKDGAVIVASKKAHAHEFISEFKDGYETLVGERGVKLSGGQRQRVAIARVMLKNAPILVLDEATSSLDSISENLIQEAFDEAMKGKTTLVIAHRLSTIQKMDRIVVLDKGKIVEDGSHSELLEKGGYYHKLWMAQKGGMI